MKLPGLFVILALAFAGCHKPTADNTPASEPEPQPAPQKAPTAAKTPAPATPAPIAKATPPPATPELAPPGVFYLIAAARVETDSGIVGLPPGTGVKLVREGIYQTPAGEVPLDAKLLTNDMTLARKVLNADRAKQAATKARLASDAAVAAAREKAAAMATPAPTPFAPQTSAPYVGGTQGGGSGLQSSTALGSTHTRVANGVVWELSADGRQWVAVKWVRSSNNGLLPPNIPVH